LFENLVNIANKHRCHHFPIFNLKQQSRKMESKNQSSNRCEKKDDVLLEMKCVVELTENQNADETCVPPNLHGDEDDNQKSKYKYNVAFINDA